MNIEHEIKSREQAITVIANDNKVLREKIDYNNNSIKRIQKEIKYLSRMEASMAKKLSTTETSENK